MILSRRFILGGLIAAPAIVAVSHIMPIKAFKLTKTTIFDENLLLSRIKQDIMDTRELYLFELNNNLTRHFITKDLNYRLSTKYSKEELIHYEVICNNTNNLLNDNNSIIDVHIQPTRVMKYFNINVK